MPRAASSAIPSAAKDKAKGPNATGFHLGRNQACHQCRKRKLRCDAGRPCAPCLKYHAGIIAARAVKGELFDLTPECTYDDNSGTPHQHNNTPVASTSNGYNNGHRSNVLPTNVTRPSHSAGSDSSSSPSASSGPGVGLGTLPSPQFVPDGGMLFGLPQTATPYFDGHSQYSFGPLDMPYATNAPFDAPQLLPTSMLNGSSSMGHSLSAQTAYAASPVTPTFTGELIPSAYPSQLPPVPLLTHLLDLFFEKVPFGERLVHRPSFMASLQHPPTSASYPSTSLLHTMCAIASVYSPIIEQRKSRLSPGRSSWNEYFTHADELKLETGDVEDRRGTFGIEQASIGRGLTMFDLRTGQRLFDTVRALICLIWYYHATGLHSDAWSMGGLAMRMATGCGLHQSGIRNDRFAPSQPVDWGGYPGSQEVIDEESRRNTFWLIWAIDMTAHMGRYDPPSINAADVWQELPCTLQSFNLGLPSQKPRQNIQDDDVLTNHPAHLTDSFTLYLKSILVGSRIASFNARLKMKRESQINNGLLPPEAAFNPVGMFSSMRRMVQTNAPTAASPGVEGKREEIRDTPAFRALEDSLMSFRASFPPHLADAIKPHGSPALFGWSGARALKSVDGALYLAHVIAALSIIRLHEAHADFYAAEDRSRQHVIRAGRYITDSLHALIATSFDVSLIYPTSLTAWLNAGRLLILLYQISLERGHIDDAHRLVAEVDAIGVAMGRMSERIPLANTALRMLNDMLQVATSGVGKQSFFQKEGVEPPNIINHGAG